MSVDAGRLCPLTPGEALGRVEAEIRQAKAEALGRVGECLELLLNRLARLDRDLERARAAAIPGTSDHRRLVDDVAARNRLRDEAVRRARDLVIQREAIGIVHHSAVRERYPVPPPYRLDSSPEASPGGTAGQDRRVDGVSSLTS